MSYKERLAHLNLQPLEWRRLHLDLIFHYKIWNNRSSIDEDEVFPVSLRNPRPSFKSLCLPLNAYFHRFVIAQLIAVTPSHQTSKMPPLKLLVKKALQNNNLTSFLYTALHLLHLMISAKRSIQYLCFLCVNAIKINIFIFIFLGLDDILAGLGLAAQSGHCIFMCFIHLFYHVYNDQ